MIRITNSFCHTAETNIRLKSNYASIKILKNLLELYFRNYVELFSPCYP